MHRQLSIILYLFFIPVLFGVLYSQADTPDLSTPITLKRAIRLAKQYSLNLQVHAELAEAADGQVVQSALKPNPVLSAEVENVMGTGLFKGMDAYEVTVGISQLIETASKQKKRAVLARSDSALVDWERNELIVQLETDVREMFIRVLLAQEELIMQRDLLKLAETAEAETGRLVDAAHSKKADLSRARLAVSQHRFNVQQLEWELGLAKSELSSFWGVFPTTEYSLAGKLELEATLPDLEELVQLLPDTVAMGKFDMEAELREAALALEKAQAAPDFEVFAGARYFEEDAGDRAFVFGIEIPIPLFHKNQGNIRTARARLRSVDIEREAKRREILNALVGAHSQMAAAFQAAATIKSELLPQSNQTMKEMWEGYQRGQHTLLSALESRKVSFEVGKAYLEAMGRYADASICIESITRPVQLKNQ